MYEAIVFLPLLGAVIAGAIALIGARNRLPGADPPPPRVIVAPSVPSPASGGGLGWGPTAKAS